MSPNDLHISLLRPPVLHILRAAGFQSARPAAVDSLVDLAARYLDLLANKTAAYAWSNHGDSEAQLEDVCMALEAVGAFRPEHGPLQDQLSDDDDTRGLDAFVAWAQGNKNKEIMRIAGLASAENEAVDLGGAREDFLASQSCCAALVLGLLTMEQCSRKSIARPARSRAFKGPYWGSAPRRSLRGSTVTPAILFERGRTGCGRPRLRPRRRCPMQCPLRVP